MPQPESALGAEGFRAISPKACARNSLTPARPVRLTHTGPDSGATSILKSRNGQHLRSKEIHSASCASAMRSVEICTATPSDSSRLPIADAASIRRNSL